ncbi:NUDIX domain-containing protein [Thermosynechococcus sichuanensis E542]|uniref:NUDIX domain-containing protein n=1 Tax=Thermosynechococcus sichuanensis E542 TaxID=2016101 RepID=A0A3B7ME03_9CYAN|nr:NUDIX domain-containing protein [Thermosynechococcus vestitus]AXY68112.1 NUDIX domain-containing protein [Thermosynechococcus vestitus E542]
MPATTIVPVALAILYQGDRVLMQLRDDYPHILYAGHWGLFGGHLEPEEAPLAGLQREVYEEIGYCPPHLTFFGEYGDRQVHRYIFSGPLTCELGTLVLSEGQGMDLVPYDSVVAGVHYAQILGENRPLGDIHQRILLDFFAQFRRELPV